MLLILVVPTTALLAWRPNFWFAPAWCESVVQCINLGLLNLCELNSNEMNSTDWNRQCQLNFTLCTSTAHILRNNNVGSESSHHSDDRVHVCLIHAIVFELIYPHERLRQAKGDVTTVLFMWESAVETSTDMYNIFHRKIISFH